MATYLHVPTYSVVPLFYAQKTLTFNGQEYTGMAMEERRFVESPLTGAWYLLRETRYALALEPHGPMTSVDHVDHPDGSMTVTLKDVHR